MIIYIRHCEDNEADATFCHDAKITSHGKKKAKKKVKELVQKYGYPSRILCSPFLRARQTLEIFKSILKKLDPEQYAKLRRQIEIDTRLGRFFTPEQQKHPEVRGSTKKYQPPVKESINKFVRRLEKQANRCYQKGYFNDDGHVVWCISHGLAIKKLLLSLGLDAPESVPFLESYPMISRDGKAAII